MNEAIWATWYDLADEDREATLSWLHANYLPFLSQQPGYAWVAHYRNVGPGPSLASYHDFAGHTPDTEGVETGSQYVILVGAASTHTFLKPVFTELATPADFAVVLDRRKNLRHVIFAEEARVNGPASDGRLPGSCGYTDSRADLPMLAICERALVVNPDARLSAIALENEWEIVRPTRPWKSPLDRALRLIALLFGIGSDPGGINAARP